MRKDSQIKKSLFVVPTSLPRFIDIIPRKLYCFTRKETETENIHHLIAFSDW